MPRTLRLPGEHDRQFRSRAERAARAARVLIEAALANCCIRAFIADPELPYTETSVRLCPTIRLEYEQARAIGELGICVRATKAKHWGSGPYVLPLRPDDPVDPFRVLFVYKPNGLSYRRFEQRRRLKELLGKRHRTLVTAAKRFNKSRFLELLTDEQTAAIGRRLDITPGRLWRAVQGKEFLPLPARSVQLHFSFLEDEPVDPTVCYLEMFQAMKDGDCATARERANDLKAWLASGGFYPPNYTKEEVDGYLANVLRRTQGGDHKQ